MLRRKYIALAATILFILCMVLKRLLPSNSFSPNDYLSQYYEYPLLLIQIMLMRVAYVAKNDDTKNIVTGMTVIIAMLYMLLFFYVLVTS